MHCPELVELLHEFRWTVLRWTVLNSWSYSTSSNGLDCPELVELLHKFIYLLPIVCPKGTQNSGMPG